MTTLTKPVLANVQPLQIATDLRKLEAEMNDAFFERRDAIRTVLLCLLAASHGFILGPPGTGKSLMLETICKAIKGGKYWRILLDRQMGKEDSFGEIDITKYLNGGGWSRNTADTFADAIVALLDEALALTTFIPTPDGWTTIGKLSVGDRVLGTGGTSTAVTGITAIANDRPCFTVTFSDGTSVVADAGHKWWARRAYATSTWRQWTTEELASPVHDTSSFAGMPIANPGFYLPTVAPVELPVADLALDPYFVGLWLGNGNAKSADVYLRPEDADRAMGRLNYHSKVLGFSNDRETLLNVSFAGNGIRRALGELGMLHDKQLPDIFLRGSVDQRLRLLQGLMDTDGWTDGLTCILSNTNVSIVEGAAEVLRSLGITAVVTQSQDERVGTHGPHRPCFKVTFGYQPGLPPFFARKVDYRERKHQMRRRIVSVVPAESVPVRCIAVDAPDHLFLAGEGMAPTHNCGNVGPAVMNAYLTVMEERQYKPNGHWMKVPLISAFGASNFWLEDMPAMWDRFLVRFTVDYIKEDSNWLALMQRAASNQPFPTIHTTIDLTDLQHAIAVDVPNVIVPPALIEAFLEIKHDLAREQIVLSDRRWDHMWPLVKASALLEGRTTAQDDDLAVMVHMAWELPEHAELVRPIILGRTNPLVKEAMEWIKQIDSITKQVNAFKGKAITERADYAGTANFELDEIEAKLTAAIKTATDGGRNTIALTEAQDTLLACRIKVYTDAMGMPAERVRQLFAKTP